MRGRTACTVSLVLMVALFLPGPAKGADAGLVGWWKLNEVDGFVASDSSGNGLDGTLVGDPQWVPGKIGGALRFGGVRDWVDCGTSPLLDIRDRITMACWVNVTVFTKPWEAFVTKGDHAYRITASQSGGTCHVGLNGTKVGWFDGKTRVDGGWHHVAGVYDGTQAILYVDGVADVVKTTSGRISVETAGLFIGCNADETGRPITGMLDDVRIYNRALKPTEIPVILYGESYPFAYDPDPADKAALSEPMVTLGWKPGGSVDAQQGHRVYLDADRQKVVSRDGCQINGVSTTSPSYPIPAPLGLGRTYYWAVDEVSGAAVSSGPIWSFSVVTDISSNPVPADRAELVDPNVTLEWVAGVGAVEHIVYLGENLAAVTAGTGGTWKGVVTGPRFHAGVLRHGTTYYWRVDESDGETAIPGEVWRFTTIGSTVGTVAEYYNNRTLEGEPVLVRTDYNIDFDWGIDTPGGPVNTDDFSVRWTGVLQVPFAGPYTFSVYCLAEDGVRLWVDGQRIINNWPASDPNGFAGTIDLHAGQVPVVMEFYETEWGAVAKLSWESPSRPRQIIPVGAFFLPVKAGSAAPPDDAADVSRNPTLRWTLGLYAATHDVYLGADANGVRDAGPSTAGIYRGNRSDTEYSPEILAANATYYWRIDEVNDTHPDRVWKGDVWSFTTGNHIALEDFEAYDDACNRVFFAWLGGASDSGSQDPNCPRPAYTGNGTGSTIGNYDPPFAEQTVVYSGRQSMPMEYDNTVGPFYSEATKEWPTPQSWTDGGVDTLSVHMQGAAPGFLETADGTILMNGTGADIWGTTDQLRFAYRRLTGNGSITAKVEGLTDVDTNAKAGVMIRETLDEYSMHALVDITPSAGLEFIRRVATLGDSASTVQADLTAPYWVRLTRNGETFTAQCSADGVTWTSVGTDPAASIASIPMGQDVYIGLAVTSREAGSVCAATFSNISTTGTVTGAWENAGVGAVAQAAGNTPETFTVSVQDSAGKAKTVSHTDPAVIATGDWEQWDIPLSEFTSAGVNLGSVTKLTVGIGSPGAGAPGGSGKVYIDDIRLTKVGP